MNILYILPFQSEKPLECKALRNFTNQIKPFYTTFYTKLDPNSTLTVAKLVPIIQIKEERFLPMNPIKSVSRCS